MLSALYAIARPSVCQMPSSVHTGSRWLVVSIVEFHAHVTVQRWCETSKDGTKSPWYEGYEKSMVRNVHGTKSPPIIRNVYGTNSLWYEKSGSRCYMPCRVPRRVRRQTNAVTGAVLRGPKQPTALLRSATGTFTDSFLHTINSSHIEHILFCNPSLPPE